MEKLPTDSDQERHISAMLSVNERQRQYYETPVSPHQIKGGLITTIWAKARTRLNAVRRELGIEAQVDDLHRHWMGDLASKRVLDLGCHSGNRLSLELASESMDYLGIDLSEAAIAVLQSKLDDLSLKSARCRAVDFLSPEFGNEKFDVIYAHGVAHHFRHFETLLQKLSSHLSEGGVIITYDPLETSRAVKLARVLYRPFQTDSEWEWPFNESNFDSIAQYFEIVSVQGIIGRIKWCLPLAFCNVNWGVAAAKRLQANDWEQASTIGPGLWRCMHVTMCLAHR